MIPQFKRDSHIILAQVVVTLALFAMFAKGAITWQQVIGAILLLQFPSLFGRKDASK